jgi:hypothetical protein
MPLTLVPGSKTWRVQRRYSPRLSRLPPFCAFDVYVMYISIFLHMLMYKDIEKLMSLCPRVPTPPAIASWGSYAQVRHAAHPQRGETIINRHDHAFPEKGHRVALVDFQASGEGPRSHEILHQATVPELVLDRVGMVRTSLLQKPLEVIREWPCLTLATSCGDHGAHHAGVAHLLIVAAIIVGRGYDLLMALLALLLAALLGILDDDIGRCFPHCYLGPGEVGSPRCRWRTGQRRCTAPWWCS